MAGVITACIALLVMALVAVFAGIVTVVATVSGFSKTPEGDDD
ncbi:MAG: hypothetical protein Q4B01_06970 [Eubacteriales bacterium]|nr:hypothetical protein [Eubacteriales bacterium]